MHKALLTFSNGETLELEEGQSVVPVSKFAKGEDISVSLQPDYEVWHHYNDGLIPSIAELLVKNDFFHLADNSNKLYCSSAVVTIENL